MVVCSCTGKSDTHITLIEQDNKTSAAASRLNSQNPHGHPSSDRWPFFLGVPFVQIFFGLQTRQAEAKMHALSGFLPSTNGATHTAEFAGSLPAFNRPPGHIKSTAQGDLLALVVSSPSWAF